MNHVCLPLHYNAVALAVRVVIIRLAEAVDVTLRRLITCHVEQLSVKCLAQGHKRECSPFGVRTQDPESDALTVAPSRSPVNDGRQYPNTLGLQLGLVLGLVPAK